MSIADCYFVELPSLNDERGILTYAENQHLPFAIQRIYYLHQVPVTARRGAHAHWSLEQLIIPLNGSFTINIDDGDKQEEIKLTASTRGFYIAPMIWRDLYDFSQDAVCLVLASALYDELDYYHSYDTFVKHAKLKNSLESKLSR